MNKFKWFSSKRKYKSYGKIQTQVRGFNKKSFGNQHVTI